MFIGRDTELQELKRFAERKTSGIIVCWGRRRVGKSTLIEHFAKDARLIEFYGLAPRKNISARDQLKHFGELLGSNFKIAPIPFDNWNTAFSTLASLTSTGPYIIFFDEISWMAGKDKDFVGKLKGMWDTQFKKNPELILVLCGSVSSWIQENILEDKGFVGRVSLSIHLKELPLYDANKFWLGVDTVSSYEKFKIFCVTGGIPRYLEEINPHESAENNIKRLCFSPGGVLVDESDKIFKDLFSKQADEYKTIAQCLVNAPQEIEAICKKIGISQTGSFNKKLSVLEKCGFITRDFAWQGQEKKQKISKYRLSDNYLRFYLKYIEPKKNLTEQGLYHDLHLDDFDDWYSMMGLQFENLVLNNLPIIQKILDISPSSILSMSPYFQNKTQRVDACQVDLLIQTKFTVYVCEIKFRREITTSVVIDVMEKIKRLKIPKTISVRPVLIYQGTLADAVRRENFFSKIINFDELIKKG